MTTVLLPISPTIYNKLESEKLFHFSARIPKGGKIVPHNNRQIYVLSGYSKTEDGEKMRFKKTTSKLELSFLITPQGYFYLGTTPEGFIERADKQENVAQALARAEQGLKEHLLCQV